MPGKCYECYQTRWKEIISNRVDSKALKATLPDVYSQFCRSISSKRFTIA